MTKPVLVTSAAGGTQGKTGRHVAELLLARKIPVRAFVRKIDERSDQLKALGAEIFVGDFLEVKSVMKAVQGTSSIYYAYPVQEGLGDATAAMAYAAKKEGISRVVNLVMFQSSTEAPTPRMRQNFLSEQVFAWAGVGEVHIRATVFYENLARLVRQLVRGGHDQDLQRPVPAHAPALKWRHAYARKQPPPAPGGSEGEVEAVCNPR
jgi:uncharacterized protein YbjT (DUF2867 family)